MSDSRDVFDNQKPIVAVELNHYDAVCKERDEYRKTIILQGEEVERLNKIIEEGRKENKELRQGAKDWLNSKCIRLSAEVERLKDELEHAEKKCEILLSASMADRAALKLKEQGE